MNWGIGTEKNGNCNRNCNKTNDVWYDLSDLASSDWAAVAGGAALQCRGGAHL